MIKIIHVMDLFGTIQEGNDWYLKGRAGMLRGFRMISFNYIVHVRR